MRSVPIKRQSPAAHAGAGAEKLTANASESAQEPPRRRLVKNATFSDDEDDVGDNDNDRDAEVSDDNDDDDAPLSKRAKGRSPPARKPAATASAKPAAKKPSGVVTSKEAKAKASMACMAASALPLRKRALEVASDIPSKKGTPLPHYCKPGKTTTTASHASVPLAAASPDPLRLSESSHPLFEPMALHRSKDRAGMPNSQALRRAGGGLSQAAEARAQRKAAVAASAAGIAGEAERAISGAISGASARRELSDEEDEVEEEPATAAEAQRWKMQDAGRGNGGYRIGKRQQDDMPQRRPAPPPRQPARPPGGSWPLSSSSAGFVVHDRGSQAADTRAAASMPGASFGSALGSNAVAPFSGGPGGSVVQSSMHDAPRSMGFGARPSAERGAAPACSGGGGQSAPLGFGGSSSAPSGFGGGLTGGPAKSSLGDLLAKFKGDGARGPADGFGAASSGIAGGFSSCSGFGSMCSGSIGTTGVGLGSGMSGAMGGGMGGGSMHGVMSMGGGNMGGNMGGGNMGGNMGGGSMRGGMVGFMPGIGGGGMVGLMGATSCGCNTSVGSCMGPGMPQIGMGGGAMGMVSGYGTNMGGGAMGGDMSGGGGWGAWNAGGAGGGWTSGPQGGFGGAWGQ